MHNCNFQIGVNKYSIFQLHVSDAIEYCLSLSSLIIITLYLSSMQYPSISYLFSLFLFECQLSIYFSMNCLYLCDL